MGTPIRLIVLLFLIGATILFFRWWTKSRASDAVMPQRDLASQPAAIEPRPDPMDMPSDTRHETEQADYGA